MDPVENVEIVSAFKARFDQKIIQSRSDQRGNSVFLSSEKYNKIIKEVQQSKVSNSKKPRDYWILKTYDVLIVQNKAKLIVPVREATSDIIYYVTDEELFDILHSIHISVGHGGRDRMLKETKKKYKNITQADIKIFLEMCESCQQKLKKPKKGIVVKPLLFSEMNSRCQVDLIDFQSQPDGPFKFIMVYQDHLTKFVVLNALERKTAEEVAQKLVDIFTFIGAPSVLQSDNGREFSNQVIESLKYLWPDLKIVHGKPRHSQSQGSVERANQDIENMLTTWMQDNKTSSWKKGLRFVQLMKNKAYHAGKIVKKNTCPQKDTAEFSYKM
jgi:Integrase zinc binding domain